MNRTRVSPGSYPADLCSVERKRDEYSIKSRMKTHINMWPRG